MDERLKILCNLYDKSDENIDLDALLKVCFFKNLEEVFRLLSHKQQVKFAYMCSKSVLHLGSEISRKEMEECLKLVKKWLKNPNNVFYDELRSASDISFNAYKVAHDDAYALNNTNIAYPAYAVHAAIYSITCDFDAAFAASRTAVYAYSAAKNKQEQKYKNLCFLVKVIRG